MKRKLSLLLCVCMMVMACCSTAGAVRVLDHPPSEQEIAAALHAPTPRVNTPCSGGNGICQMYAQGLSYVYDENGNLLNGMHCCWQCANCHNVMATDGDPKQGAIIGNYVVAPLSYDLGLSVANYIIVNASDVRYCNKTYLSGYAFHYD